MKLQKKMFEQSWIGLLIIAWVKRLDFIELGVDCLLKYLCDI